MEQVIGIQFNGRGSVYPFSSGGIALALRDRVIVEIEQGVSLGVVVSLEQTPASGAPESEPAPKSPADEPTAGGPHADGDGGVQTLPGQPPRRTSAGAQALTPIVRRATEEDLATAESNITLAREAVAYCRECIRQRGLDMKLVDVEVFFDRSKMVFFFTAPARIDFRDLVKDLVHSYRTRIELRQIGVRHETQMIGALGNCGMVCCCRRYLRKFAPVTIKMAKEQNLFLNPAKISGICGRLLCCLSYEQDNYEAFHRSCPRLGKRYQTSRGMVKVLRSNMFRNSLIVLTETNEEQEITLPDWEERAPRRPDQQQLQQSGQDSGRQRQDQRERDHRGRAPDRMRRDETPGRDDAEERFARSAAPRPDADEDLQDLYGADREFPESDDTDLLEDPDEVGIFGLRRQPAPVRGDLAGQNARQSDRLPPHSGEGPRQGSHRKHRPNRHDGRDQGRSEPDAPQRRNEASENRPAGNSPPDRDD
jgi:cell fate regulator YaaT (PSP1 superfamily)